MTRNPLWLLAFITLVLPFGVTDAATAHQRLKPKQKYRITWQESEGRIETNTICRRYARGSLDYRQCRSYALDFFQNKCDRHTRQFQQSGGRERSRQHTLKLKFCAAARALP